MNQMFRSDMENPTQIDLDGWKRRGLCERLEETAARIIEPLL
jgi:predicted aconitase